MLSRDRLGIAVEGASSKASGECLVSGGCSALHALQAQIRELESRVATDSLTGLWNRAHFEQVIEKELERSRRHKQPLSLILFDIDHFKQINDHHGHQAGDKVLRELALISHAAIRTSDALFRWGGEEFAVLAPSTGHQGAAQLAETLRGQIAHHRFPVAGTITVSLGVAEHAGQESPEAWFGRADAMLYAAKVGRNVVCTDACGDSDQWCGCDEALALRLVWQEAFCCGEPTIDHEHLQLFELANHLIRTAIDQGEDAARITGRFDELLTHIARHFASEERLLAQAGYGGLAAHQRGHEALLARAQDLRETVACGGAGIGGLIEFLVRDVVANHLLKADRDFFPVFQNRSRR